FAYRGVRLSFVVEGEIIVVAVGRGVPATENVRETEPLLPMFKECRGNLRVRLALNCFETSFLNALVDMRTDLMLWHERHRGGELSRCNDYLDVRGGRLGRRCRRKTVSLWV